MATLFRLHTLGSLQLVAPTGEVVRQQRRRLALLALVAAAGDRGASRDKLMAWLSPERASDAARHSLHQLLYYVRRQVGDDVFTGSDPLRLNSALLACDLVDFEAAVRERALERAAEVYKGPFLEGFHLPESPEFDEWASMERARLAALFAESLLTLAGEATVRGDHRSAARWWQRLTTNDPLSSRAALGLMRSLVASGDTPAALVHARLHAQLVRAELGSVPDPEFTAFVAALQRPPASLPRIGEGVEVARGPDVTPASDVSHDSEIEAARQVSGAPVKIAPEREPSPIAARMGIRGGRRWVGAGLVTALAAGALLSFDRSAAPRSSPMASRPLSREHQILVGDFDAASRDSLSARALSEALRGALQASRAVTIVSRAEVDRALRKMEQPISAPLKHALAYELAVRNGYEAVLTGAITPLGTGYVLSAVLTTGGGQELASLSESAPSADALIPAVGRLSHALRRVIGESTSDIGTAKPLEQVTTASLRALQLYTQAMDETREGRGETPFTLGLLRQAIAHDSVFAMAHRLLGIKLYNVDSTQEALRELRIAERYSDRLTEVERLSALSTLHLILRDYSTSFDEAAAVRMLDPNSSWALNQLVIVANFLGRYEESRHLARERARIDSSGRPYLVPVSLFSGQRSVALAEARRYFDQHKRSPESSSAASARKTMTVVHAAIASFDSAEFYAVPGVAPDPGDVERLVASRLARGRMEAAFAAMGAQPSADESSVRRLSAIWASHAALAELLMRGDSASAARRLDALLADREYNRGNPANRRLNHVLALALAGRIADARRELAVIERSSGRDMLIARDPELSLARGAVALAGGEVARSIDFLRSASSSVSFGYDACRVCALPWLGRAYQAAGATDSAVVVYERFLSLGDVDRASSDGLWRAFVLRQLGSLHAQRGDPAKAIERLEDFVTLWRGADAALQPQVAVARRRIADLRATRITARGAVAPSRP